MTNRTDFDKGPYNKTFENVGPKQEQEKRR